MSAVCVACSAFLGLAISAPSSSLRYVQHWLASSVLVAVSKYVDVWTSKKAGHCKEIKKYTQEYFKEIVKFNNEFTIFAKAKIM